MKRNFRRGFAVALCLAMVCGLFSGAFGVVSVANAAGTQIDGNLLSNPSFEEVTISGWTGGMQTKADKFAGTYSLMLQDASATEVTESVSAPVAVDAAAYIASAMVKGAGVVATIGLRYFDANGAVLAYATKESNPGATGWQELSVKANAPAGAATVSIVLGTTAATQGTVYFDNTALAASADTAIDPVVANGNFEGAWDTETGLPSGWKEGNVGDTNSRSVVKVNGNQVLELGKLAADNNRASVNSGRFPVTSGEVYNLTLDARNVSGGATLLIQLYFYTAETGGSSQNVSSSYVLGNDWETIHLSGFTAQGYTYAYIDISVRNAIGTVQIDNVSLSLADGEMINTSFEGAVATDGSSSGWSRGAGGVAGRNSVVTGGLSGNALLLDKTAAGNGDVFSNYIPVAPGEQYTITFYLKGDAVTSLTQAIPYYYTSSSVMASNSSGIGTSIAAATKTLTPSGEWTQYTINLTVPEGAIAVRLRLLTRGSAVGKAYYDDITFDLLVPTNAITFGSFESTEGWTANEVFRSGESVELVSGGGPDGSNCLKATASGAYVWPQIGVTLTGGQTYVMSVDLKSDGTNSSDVFLRLYNNVSGSTSAVGEYQQDPGAKLTNSGDWQHFEWVVTVPEYATTGRADIVCIGSAGRTVYIDNVSLVPLVETGGPEDVAVTNGDFETVNLADISGWHNVNSFYSVLSSEAAFDGNWSLRFNYNGGNVLSQYIPVKAGQTLKFTANSNAAAAAALQVYFYGFAEKGATVTYDGGTLFGSGAFSAVSTSGNPWPELTQTATVPEGVNYLIVRIYSKSAGNIDNVSLTCAHTYGTWVDEVPATHTANGTKGYKPCTYCEKKFDANGNELTDLTISNEAHAATPTTLTKDAIHHWYKCTVDGCTVVIGTKEEHQYTDAGDKICDVCLYERGCQHANMDNIDAVPEVHTATEQKGAIAAHKQCLDCGKLFTLENTETTIAELTAAAPTHTYGAWANSQDGTKHERTCTATTCGKVESGDHTGGTATCTTEKVCTTCNLAYGEKLGHALTPVAAVEEKHTQTELVAGVAAHYKCGNCNKLFSDEAGTTEVTLAQLTGTTPTHSANAEWKGNAEKHWYECSCGLKSDEGQHTPLDDDDLCTTPVLCSTCQLVVVPAKTHTYTDACDEQCDNIDCLFTRDAGHNLTAVPEKPATTEEEGHEAYWTCECGKWFADADATTEITDKDSIVIDKLTGGNDGGNAGNNGGNDSEEDDVPKTGDNTVLVLALTLLTLCGAVLIVVNTKFGFRK